MKKRLVFSAIVLGASALFGDTTVGDTGKYSWGANGGDAKNFAQMMRVRRNK